jgi:hypothetical protein
MSCPREELTEEQHRGGGGTGGGGADCQSLEADWMMGQKGGWSSSGACRHGCRDG